MEDIKQSIGLLSDEELVNQYLYHKDEYTVEAFEFLGQEVEERKLQAQIKKTEEQKNEVIQLNEDDFIKLDHTFKKIDLDLALAILRDEKILFFIDNSVSTIILPTENEVDQQYTVHVLKKMHEKAREIIDEYFEEIEGRYFLKKRSAFEQLKSFSFNQLHISEVDAAEYIEVDFLPQEKRFLIEQGTHIIENADAIETESGRVIFYFDNIESVLTHLSQDTDNSFMKSELLAILEVLQISLEMQNLPDLMEDAIETLLNLFLQ